MKPSRHRHGIVAILDALGASNYTDAEIKRFMQSRRIVLGLLNEKAEFVTGKLDVRMITTFTFNDTVLIILKSKSRTPNVNEIKAFFLILRNFLVSSLANNILFRGSISIGSFYVSEQSNTVMGQAITDAAAWYDKPDWIGVIATPLASIRIQNVVEKGGKDWDYLMVDYEVPLKNGEKRVLKAVNWPRVFYVNSLTPCKKNELPREKVLELLGKHNVPFGTENKFFNSIKFFDHVVKEQYPKYQTKTSRKK
jgi:hypothetical protein